MIKGTIRRVVNTVLSPFGVEVRKASKENFGEGYPNYLKEAQKEGMDVNDWIEQKMGWSKTLPVLDQVVFPYLRDDSVVCELGIGTGRWSRHLAKKLAKGELHLVDHSPWLVDFCEKYFQSKPQVRIYLNDGCSLPFPKTSWIDVIFSNGTFIYLKLSFFYLYSLEFFRVLKLGVHVIFNYIDPVTAEGWHFLQADSNRWFTYHSCEVVDKVLSSVGFRIVTHQQIGKSTYVVARKPLENEYETGIKE